MLIVIILIELDGMIPFQLIKVKPGSIQSEVANPIESARSSLVHQNDYLQGYLHRFADLLVNLKLWYSIGCSKKR